MAGSSPAMTLRVRCANFSIVIFSIHLLTHAPSLPRGASRRASVQIVGFEPFAPPSEGSGAPKVAARIAAPLVCLAARPIPSADGIAGP